MNKNRIYISGGITGIQDYMERFAKVQEELEEQGYSVINPALIISKMPEDMTYEEIMKIAFAMLDTADIIYMMKDWKESLGANREYGYALGTDKTIIFE